MEYTTRYESPLGGLTLAGVGDALTGIWFDGQAHFARTLDAQSQEGALAVFNETKRWLDLYFRGERPDFAPKLTLKGTAFQLAVWELLLKIPYGETRTYGNLAKDVANHFGRERMSAQAVGGAVGRNPIGLIVPCHRVVGANGALTGYAAGLDKKRRLLELEQGKSTSVLFSK